MRRFIVFLGTFVILGVGCQSADRTVEPRFDMAETESVQEATESEVVLPMDGLVIGHEPRYKRFGEFFDDRFRGYHTGEDAEVPPEDLAPGEVQLVPVRAVADGTVVYLSRVSGYGGVIVLQHEFGGEELQTLYGHLDLDSAELKTGDAVAKGQFLANLGADRSDDTDGERQHLHFAVYPGTEVRLQGYVNSPAELAAWINPFDFFKENGALEADLMVPNPDELIDTNSLGIFGPPWDPQPRARSAFANLSFSLPGDWDVEYVPSLEALNLYTVSGEGSARERSQIFIRYFDANDFLTLSTVEVLSSQDLTVGLGDYVARRYVIKKKPGVADFLDQPLWRNVEHTVTDFRSGDGFTRYFVVAANPELDQNVYAAVLESMEINQ
jgi:hypothetical protein